MTNFGQLALEDWVSSEAVATAYIDLHFHKSASIYCLLLVLEVCNVLS